MKRILIIDDDRTFGRLLENFLENNGYEVQLRYTLKDGFDAFLSGKYDILLLDYRLPDGTGMDLIQNPRFYAARIPTIIMTNFLDIRTAIRAIKAGALEYITKPINPDELLMILRDTLIKIKQPVRETPNSNLIHGKSKIARQVFDHIKLVAPTNMSVLIQGESGTGKEHVARSIHQLSTRAKGPFVALDCGALSAEIAGSELFGHAKGAFTGAIRDKKGQFEMADKGTLFLDEIGNLGYEIQVKLLRVLQEQIIHPIGDTRARKIDVRLVAATNEDLHEKAMKGGFREDLYHRINEFAIQVPALRERTEDIPLFVRHFVYQANIELSKEVTDFTPEVKEIFMTYEWPGNLRELKNVVKRAVLLAGKGEAGIDTLPDEMSSLLFDKKEKKDSNPGREISEKEQILMALKQTKYNKTKAAKLLKVDRKTLYNKIWKYNIET